MDSKVTYRNNNDPTSKRKRPCLLNTKEGEILNRVKAKIRDKENGLWQDTLQSHLKALSCATPLVDCTPPRVPKHIFSSALMTRLNRQGFMFQKIEKQNAIMLQSISQIYQGKRKPERDPPKILRPALARERKLIEMMHENLKKYHRLQTIEPTISRKKQHDWYKQQEKYMGFASRYPLHFKYSHCPPLVAKVLAETHAKPIIRAFLSLVVEDGSTKDEENQGNRLEVELFANACPFTAKNFAMMCENKTSGSTSYTKKTISRLISAKKPNSSTETQLLYWECAPFASVIPQMRTHMKEEDSGIPHKSKWLLTKPKGVATGEFFITMNATPFLDDMCTVFGRCLPSEGLDFLENMKNKTDILGYPYATINIADSGITE